MRNLKAYRNEPPITTRKKKKFLTQIKEKDYIMNDLNVTPLDPNNPNHLEIIVRSLNTSVNRIEDKMDERFNQMSGEIKKISAEVNKIQESSSRWLPKTLKGWIVLIGLIGTIVGGCYSIVIKKDHEQDIKLQRILAKMEDNK